MNPSPSRRRATPPAERAEFVLELPSDVGIIQGAVADLERRCREFAFGGSLLSLNLRVGVTEAITNAMLYGNGGNPEKLVRVQVELDMECVALEVADQGNGFDPASVPDPTLPENLDRPGGRGLFLIRELMDEVEFNDRGNSVRLVLYRTGP